MAGDTTDGAVEDDTLKYQLLGPSLTKAGQDAVDQQKVRLVMMSENNIHSCLVLYST